MNKSFALILLSALLVSTFASASESKTDTRSQLSKLYQRNNQHSQENENQNKRVFNRQVTHNHNKTHFEMHSDEDSNNPMKNTMGFRFQKTSSGIHLHYSVVKDTNQTEHVRMTFRKLLSNGTLLSKFGEEDFNDLVCTQVLNYNSCLLSTKNGMFGVNVDYNSVPFTKVFGNHTHQVYPTDIKVTVLINNTMTNFPELLTQSGSQNCTLVVHFNSDNDNYFSNFDSDNFTDFTSGNLTYTTFEKYSLDQNNVSQPVYFNPAPTQLFDEEFTNNDEDEDEDEDEEHELINRHEVHFTFESNGIIRWDPTIGGTESFTGASGSSLTTGTNTTNNNLYFIALLGLVVIVLVVVVVVRVKKNKKQTADNKQLTNITNSS